MAARTPPAAKRAAGKGNAASNGGGTRLVIVESPAKARTIAGYLGKGYVVESSIGHIRDMPDKAAEIPEKYRKEPWARLGVNVERERQHLIKCEIELRGKTRISCVRLIGTVARGWLRPHALSSGRARQHGQLPRRELLCRWIAY